MSILRVPLPGATADYPSGKPEIYFQGKAQFCFFRKGSAVSGNTDVAVYADNEYMGIMSISEHFKLNRTVNTWKFRPVDPLLVGEFVLADSAEEYSTSQVAGSVSIIGQSHVIIDSNFYPSRIERADNNCIFSLSGSLAAATTTELFISAIGGTASKKLYLSSAKVWSANLSSATLAIGHYSGGSFSGEIDPQSKSQSLVPGYQYAAYTNGGAVTGKFYFPIEIPPIVSNLTSFNLDEYLKINSSNLEFVRIGITNGASVATNFSLEWMER